MKAPAQPLWKTLPRPRSPKARSCARFCPCLAPSSSPICYKRFTSWRILFGSGVLGPRPSPRCRWDHRIAVWGAAAHPPLACHLDAGKPEHGRREDRPRRAHDLAQCRHHVWDDDAGRERGLPPGTPGRGRLRTGPPCGHSDGRALSANHSPLLRIYRPPAGAQRGASRLWQHLHLDDAGLRPAVDVALSTGVFALAAHQAGAGRHRGARCRSPAPARPDR